MTIILVTVVVGLVGLALGVFSRDPAQAIFTNSTVGTHTGNVSRQADAAISRRHLLVKQGSDATHVSLSGSGDRPLGICTDEADAAGDLVNIALLGSARSTLKMVAGGAISVGAVVYGVAGGKIGSGSLPAGNYYAVGAALTAASTDGDIVEVDPCFPRAETIEE